MATLAGLVRLHLRIRRCPNGDCAAYHKPYRPEAEGRLALPHHEFGLDVIALVGSLRHAEHRSVPEIHAELIVLVLDDAGWHISGDLVVPPGIEPAFLPSYTPELQPAEHSWPLADEAAWRTSTSSRSRTSTRR